MIDFTQVPGAAIYDPLTGETVPAGGTVYVNYGANSGVWVGDPTFGALLGVALYVDNVRNSVLDLSRGSTSPLPWNSPSLGQHELVLRAYVTDYDRTRTCYVESVPEYPIAH
jgi:hypothetical protein